MAGSGGGCRAERDRCHPGSHRLHPGGGLTSGQVDAAVCYYMNEPVQMQQGGTEVNLMLVADYAASLPTRHHHQQATIAERPDLVERPCVPSTEASSSPSTIPTGLRHRRAGGAEISGNREVQRASSTPPWSCGRPRAGSPMRSLGAGQRDHAARRPDRYRGGSLSGVHQPVRAGGIGRVQPALRLRDVTFTYSR